MTGFDPATTAHQVRNLGYAIVRDFTTEPHTHRLQETTAQLLASDAALPFPKSTRVWDLYRHGETFLDCVRHQGLRALLTDLLGEHFLLSDFSLNSVAPGQPVDDWHIDYPYNELAGPVDGPILGLQCVLALDDFTADNGATQLVPRTHLRPRRPDHPNPVFNVFTAPAGSLLVMAAATHHRSGINQSTQDRTAALLSFVPRWVRPMVDPPEPGPWSEDEADAIMFGVSRPPETINGIPIELDNPQ
jgi:hypothetical protein